MRAREDARLTRAPVGILIIAIAAFAAASFAHQVALYDALRWGSRDLAFFTQSLWNLTHGRGLRMTVGFQGDHLFGEHLYLTHAALAPLYAIWPDPRALMAVAAIASAVAAAGVYRVARAARVSEWGALALAVLWLAHPTVHGGASGLGWHGFHPDTQLAAILLFALDAHLRKRPKIFWPLFALSLLHEEQAALVWIGVGALFFARGERRAERRDGAIAIGVAAAWFVFAVAIAIPHFATAAGEPWYVTWARLDAISKLPATIARVAVYLGALALGLGALPLLSRASFAVAPIVGAYAIAFASARAYRLPTEIGSWHGSLVLPVLALGAAEALAKLEARFASERARRVLHGALAAWAAVVLAFTIATVYPPIEPLSDARRAELARVEREVPESASVSATLFLGSRFSNRSDLYLFPFEVRDADFVLVDTEPCVETIKDGSDAAKLKEIATSGAYELVSARDGTILVYRRRAR